MMTPYFGNRRTYGATLAELTSLEELMRTMMGEHMVHADVVNKLWQVYSAFPTSFLLHPLIFPRKTKLMKNGFVLGRYGTRNPQAAKARRNHHSRNVGPGQEGSRDRKGGQTVEDWFRTPWNGEQEPNELYCKGS